MKILLVDPGTKETGFGIWEDGAKSTWTVRTDPKEPLHERLKSIYASAAQHGPYERVVVESWERQFNPNMRYLIGCLHLLECSEFKLVSPKKWRNDMFGTFVSKKAQPAAMKLAKQGHWNPKDQHQADAACLWEWWNQHGKEES